MLLENLGDYPLSTADGIRFLFGCSCVCVQVLCVISGLSLPNTKMQLFCMPVPSLWITFFARSCSPGRGNH